MNTKTIIEQKFLRAVTIISPTADEYFAMTKALQKDRKFDKLPGHSRMGDFPGEHECFCLLLNNITVIVRVVLLGQIGLLEALDKTKEMLNYWNSNLFILEGVSGGYKERTKTFDLILPLKIHEFAIFKQVKGETKPIFQIFYTSIDYLHSLQKYCQTINLKKKYDIQNVHYDEEGVISSVGLEADVIPGHERIKSWKICGVEMEGSGVGRVLKGTVVPWTMVRIVMDDATSEGRENKDENKKKASKIAGDFTKDYIWYLATENESVLKRDFETHSKTEINGILKRIKEVIKEVIDIKSMYKLVCGLEILKMTLHCSLRCLDFGLVYNQRPISLIQLVVLHEQAGLIDKDTADFFCDIISLGTNYSLEKNISILETNTISQRYDGIIQKTNEIIQMDHIQYYLSKVF